MPFVDLPSVADPRATQLNNDAVALAHRGEYEAAATKLQTAHSLAPQDTQITHNLQAVFVSWGVEALNHNNLPEAVEPLEQALEYGEHVEALYGLGAALSQQGGEDLGMIYLQLAIYLNPEHPLALVALGDLFETLKKYDLLGSSVWRVHHAAIAASGMA